MEFGKWYNKNYKNLLLLPAIALALSLFFLFYFYSTTGDIINRDVSLTGGTTITLQTNVNIEELKSEIGKQISDFETKSISDNSGRQIEISIIVPVEDTETLIETLEEFLGYSLTSENSSRETTSASLSQDFYKQLIISILLAFFWMAATVFIIFAQGKKLKFWTIILNLAFGYFMGNFFLKGKGTIPIIIFFAFAISFIYLYIKNSVPAFAVMLSAFNDIIMTLAVVNFFGMQISSAGIVAFLMLIGYSVDTDILLTTRLLKKRGNTNDLLFGAFKTGTTMTLTSLIAIAASLIAVYSFGSVLNQIFIILLIGLSLDLFNTWITNASIIKWYVEARR